MEKNLITLLSFVLLTSLSFAKEKILEKKEYPKWVENLTNPPKVYKGIEFGENEVLDRIVKDGKYLFVYSHDDENHYVIKFDRNGHPIRNEGYRLKDNAKDFIVEFYEHSPFGCKYEKYYYYDENGELKNYSEYYSLNDEENHISKMNDKEEGSFLYKYENNGNYSRTCTRVGDDDGYIYSHLGSKCYYDKDDNLLSCFTNDEKGRCIYFSESKEFKEFVKKYEVRLPKTNSTISVFYETYKNGYQVLFWKEYLTDGWSKQNNLIENFFDQLICWYDEDGKVIHGKDSEDEWWNTYQNDKLIYRKAKSGDTYFDYDEKGNIILEKRKSDDKWYIDEYKYDDKNRVVWSFSKQVDENEQIFSSLKEERRYDNNNYVTYVKWVTNDDYEGEGWNSTVNGYRFTNIKGTLEYEFEKINDRQIKVFPQHGKHWFIVEVDVNK